MWDSDRQTCPWSVANLAAGQWAQRMKGTMMSKAMVADQPMSGMKTRAAQRTLRWTPCAFQMKTDQDPQRLYALKVVNREEPKDDARLERCRASAEASSKLKHPSILMYHDFRVRKSWFRVVRSELLMEHVAGKSLDKMEGKLKLKDWVLIFKHIAERQRICTAAE